MLLKTVYMKDASLQASSPYCLWVHRDGTPASPLVALWIDSQMRSFESNFASLEQEQDSPATLVAESEEDEPGGVGFYPLACGKAISVA